jgi:lysozyme
MQTRQAASIIGVDISDFQTITDAATLYTKADYIYLRAYGSNHVTMDPTFLERAAQARSYGCPAGAYYFATPTTPITTDGGAECEAQVEQFAAALEAGFGAGDYGDLIPMLDVESWDDTTPQKPMYYMNGTQLTAWILRVKDAFFTRTGRKLGFYSNRYFLQDPAQMAMTTEEITQLSEMPLWLAEYDVYYPANTEPTGAPANLGGWTTYNLWQYTVAVEADQWGVSHYENKIDLNRTTSIDLIMPPRPLQTFDLYDLGAGSLRIDVTHPTGIDYIGAAVFINGVYTTWLDPQTLSVTVDGQPIGQELTVLITTQDIARDATPNTATITLAAEAPTEPPTQPPGGEAPMQRGISTDTANRLLINEGVVYLNYGEAGERLLGATRGGTEFSIEQEVQDPEIDGKKGPLKGTRRIVESIATLSCELLEITRENFMLAIAGSTSTTVGIAPDDYNSVRRTRELLDADYAENIAVVGELSDGTQVIVLLYNALNTEAIALAQEDRNEATLPVTFTAHFDPADMATEPWEIRFPTAAV